MTEIVQASIDNVDHNPFRLLQKYPFVERKVEALMRSIDDVGLWEGVIARKAGRGYQIAFGHHRIEAARRNNMKRVPLIVRDLTDEQMLQFMGRENGEDYNADFIIMLETWESAAKFLATSREKIQRLDVARILGWTRAEKRGTDQLSDTAVACASAHALISGGYLKRDDLADLTVNAARLIVERSHARMEQIERVGSQNKRPAREIEQAKRHVGKAARQTAQDSRAGRVAQRDLRGKVDVHAYRNAKDAKPTPLFAVFGKAIAESISKMVCTDTVAEKLEEIVKVVGKVTLEEDKASLRHIDFALAELGERSGNWRKRLAPKGQNVVPLKLLKRG